MSQNWCFFRYQQNQTKILQQNQKNQKKNTSTKSTKSGYQFFSFISQVFDNDNKITSVKDD